MLLGLELSPQSVAVILAQEDGAADLALRQDYPAHASPATQWLLAMELVRTVMRRSVLEPGQVTRTAVAFPGPVSRAGVAGKNPRMPGWEGFDLPRAVSEHLKLANVFAVSTVTAQAWGEHLFGALRELDNWLYLHLGNSLSAACYCDGRLLHGADNRAGDLGGVLIDRDGAVDGLGRRGTLAAYCGEEAFLARARAYGMTLAASEVWHMAPTNFAAQSVTEDYTSRLAQGLGTAVALLSPETICVSGNFGAAIFEQIQAPLAAKLRENTVGRTGGSPRMVLAALGDDAAAMGAVGVALRGAP